MPCIRRRLRGALLVGLVLATLALPGTGFAEDLKSGTWTGRLMLPGDVPERVRFVVKGSGGDTAISMATKESRYPFRDISLSGSRLRFSWTPGDEAVRCTLRRQGDGRYKGRCESPMGDQITLEMVPPPAPEESDEEDEDTGDDAPPDDGTADTKKNDQPRKKGKKPGKK